MAPLRPKLRQRIKATLLGLAAVMLALLIVAVLALRSEAFWRAYIFPRYFGPYWDTALRWERFTPTVFPPGIEIRGFELKEPGLRGGIVATAEQIEVFTSWRTSSEDLRLSRIRVEGLMINYSVRADGATNLDRALARVLEGRPDEVPTMGGEGTAASLKFPRIHLGSAIVDGLTLRYSDLRDPANPIAARYSLDEPLRFSAGRGGSTEGRADELLLASALGDALWRRGAMGLEGKLDLSIAVRNLGDHPASTAEVRAVLVGRGPDPAVMTGFARMPLARSLVRPSATPIDELTLLYRPANSDDGVFRVTGGRFDPLRGSFDSDVELTARVGDLIGFIDEFATLDSADAMRTAMLAALFPPNIVLADQTSNQLNFRGTISGAGLFQYAIVDTSEQVPFQLTSVGRVRLQGVRLTALEQGYPVLFASGAAENGIDLLADWSLTLDEEADSGTARVALSVEPGAQPTDPAFRWDLVLSGRDSETEPLRFRLKPRAAPAVVPSLIAEPREPLLFADYEKILKLIDSQLAATTGKLDDHAVEGAAVRLRFTSRDPEQLRRLLRPVFASIVDCTAGQASLSIDRERSAGPLRWNGDFGFEGVRLAGLDDVTNLGGRMVVDQEESVLRVQSGQAFLFKQGASPDDVTSLSLVIEPASAGRLNQLDLATGVGELEASLVELNRDIMEILLRVQTLGLSEQLARPAYQRLLDLLGFRPGDLMASSQARMVVKATMGPEMDLSSTLSVRDLPASNFLALGDGPAPDTERFDAKLSQSFHLDRRRQLLRPRQFDLSFSLPGAEQPFAALNLEGNEDCRFDYYSLMAVGAALPPTDDRPTSNTLFAGYRDALTIFFDRVTGLRQAMREGDAQLVLTVPRLDLGEFRRTLLAAGFPVQEGIFTMRVASNLGREDGTSDVARGGFSLRGVRLDGLEKTLPDALGTLSVEREGRFLRVEDLSTRLVFDGGNATELRFRGAVQGDTADSTWTLDLKGLNADLVDALTSVRSSGVNRTVTLLNRLPLQALVEVAGQQGSVELDLTGITNGLTQSVELTARERGQSLNVFPSYFAPLSFDVVQSVTIGADNVATLTRLEGTIREEGVENSVAELSLGNPIVLSADSLDATTSTISLRLDSSLDERGQRLRSYQIPIVGRPIEGGHLRGSIDVVVPPGAVTNLDAGGIVNKFDLTVDRIRFQGIAPSAQARLVGVLRQAGRRLTVSGLSLDAGMDGESAGLLTGELAYDGESGNLDTLIELINLRPAALSALPNGWREWTTNPGTLVNGTARWSGIMQRGRGTMDLTLRAREVVLPTLQVDNTTRYEHPPLHGDLRILSTIDAPTSSVLVREFDLLIARQGYSPDGDRMDALTSPTMPLLSGRLTAPIIYRFDELTIAPAGTASSEIRGEFGPFDLSLYRTIVDRYTRLPLEAGLLQGTWSAEAFQTATRPGAAIQLDASLADGRWKQADGSIRALEATANLRGSRRRDVVRLDQLNLVLKHPGGDPDASVSDALSVQGFLRFAKGEQHPTAELTVGSTGLDLDRLLSMQADLSQPRTVEKPQPETDPPTPNEAIADQQISTFWRELDGSVAVQMTDIRFRQILFTRLAGQGTLRDGEFDVTNLTGRLNDGDVSAKGRAMILPTDVNPWSMTVAGRDIRIEPILNSFLSSEYRGLVAGRLDGTLELSGRGYGEASWRQVEGGGTLAVRNGTVEGSQLRRLVGEEPFAGTSNYLIRGNRLLFDLTTPWSPARDLTARGTIRDLLPPEGKSPYVNLVARFIRTTTVGPSGRTMEWKGSTETFRQTLLGVLVEVQGHAGPTELPKSRLRTLEY